MNPPSDREFGRLEGKVDELGRRVERMEQAITDLATASSAEHADVGRKIERLGERFEGRFERLEGRTDSLEGTRDEGKGAATLAKIVQGVGLFALAVLSIIVAKGGL